MSEFFRAQWGFPGGASGKEPAQETVRKTGSIAGSARSPGDVTTHSSILAWRIPMDREALRATVHGVAKRQT